jgi:hypothetical protein
LSAQKPAGVEDMQPKVLICTHHKCASSWVTQYLDRLAALNRLTFAATHDSRTLPEADIVCLRNADYSFVKKNGLTGIHVIRNPLSVVASAYFSHLYSHPLADWPELRAQRTTLQLVTKSIGMLITTAFLERPDFHRAAVGPLYAIRRWDYDDRGFVAIRMEDLVAEPANTLRCALEDTNSIDMSCYPADSEFAFSVFAHGRPVGELDLNSHYRIGQPDDWEKHLPPSVLRHLVDTMPTVFERYYSSALASLSPWCRVMRWAVGNGSVPRLRQWRLSGLTSGASRRSGA